MNSKYSQNLLSRTVSVLSDLISPVYPNSSDIESNSQAFTKDALNMRLTDILARELGFKGGADLHQYFKFTENKNHSDLIKKLKSNKLIDSLNETINLSFKLNAERNLKILYCLNSKITLSVAFHPSGRYTLKYKEENVVLPSDVLSTTFCGNNNPNEFYSGVLHFYHWLKDIGTDVSINVNKLPENFRGILIDIDSEDAFIMRNWIHRRYAPHLDDEAKKHIDNSLGKYLTEKKLSINTKKFGTNILTNLIFSLYDGAIVIPEFYFPENLVKDLVTHRL